MTALDEAADRIVLQAVTATGYHGVFGHEKRDGQPFSVDVAIETDLRTAGSSDDLNQTIDYGAVAETIVARITGPSFDLIESLAEHIAADVLDHPGAEKVTVTIHKPHAPIPHSFTDAMVEVTREASRPVVIALGANQGDAAATLRAAAADLARAGLHLTARSPWYRTAPVGGPDQPDYLNAVLTATTRLTPRRLLRLLHRIEARYGRERTVRWGPRTLDLDLIQYGDPAAGTEQLISATDLVVPHPRAHERAFVLVPWAQANPEAWVRLADRSVPIAQVLDGVDATDIHPADSTW